jgi:hypothetical protein
VDANPGPGTAPYIRVDFISVPDALPGGGGFHHHFAWKIDNQGVVQVFQLQGQNASLYDVLVGIGGGTASGYIPPTNKDLSALLSGTPPIGAVGESFYEWFGYPPPINPNYTLPVADPFDLWAVTLNFQPMGAGGLPGSTNRYQLSP